jgi:hypothetical protein
MVDTGIANKPMRFRIAACMLCLMMIAASVDCLPDPPAVDPHGNGNVVVAQFDHHLLTVVNSDISTCVSCGPHFQMSVVTLGQNFESRLPALKLKFIRLAVDSSPPELY